jgi:NAD(P)-dependent dehydrogenase (short-subunit alcohol dehydrogenase family)
LGRAPAKAAAAAGVNVVVAGRTYRDAGVPGISFVSTDASSMKAAAALGASVEPVSDTVIFTTGTCAGAQREETAEGLETDMATSALSRIATLNTLLPRLKTLPPAADSATALVSASAAPFTLSAGAEALPVEA